MNCNGKAINTNNPVDFKFFDASNKHSNIKIVHKVKSHLEQESSKNKKY